LALQAQGQGKAGLPGEEDETVGQLPGLDGPVPQVVAGEVAGDGPGRLGFLVAKLYLRTAMAPSSAWPTRARSQVQLGSEFKPRQINIIPFTNHDTIEVFDLKATS
jgi:hypothetical protein